MTLIDRQLYEHCLAHHREAQGHDFVVTDSMPIPFFGDLRSYQNSEFRVLTAALNPSDQEFPRSLLKGDCRFDVASGLKGAEELEQELSAYFHKNPYRRWFRAFEPLLNGMNASYGGKMADRQYGSTALHLDLCSPIATTPTWSNLGQHQRAKLTAPGRDIFHRLVEELEPDIIIASLGWAHIESWNDELQTGRTWDCPVHHQTTAEGKPLRATLKVQARVVSFGSKKPVLFVNGSAANVPFGRFTTERKHHVGQALMALMDKGAGVI